MRRIVAAMLLVAAAGHAWSADPNWFARASLPTSRYGLAAGVVGGTLYAVGGYCGIGTLEAYDPSTNVWTAKASMPTGRLYLGAGVIGGTLYAVGGSWGSNYATLEAYDSATNSWTARTPMSSVRTNLAAAAIGGTLYAVGGSNAGALTTLEAYDPATNTWTIKAAMPTARSKLAAAVIGGTLYVAGGSNGGSLATLEAYDPATNSWTTKASLPVARDSMGCAVAGGKLYLMGGFNSAGFGTTLATVDMYDPVTNTWKAMSPMLTARLYLAGAAIGGTLYSVGGFDSFTGCMGYVEAGYAGPVLSRAIAVMAPQASVGQWITVVLTVTNTGQGVVNAMTPMIQINRGSALVVPEGTVTPAGPLTLGAGAAQSFTWTYSVSGIGTVSFTATAIGTDGGTGVPAWTSATGTLNSLAGAVAVAPTPLSVGQWMSIVLTVTNNGQASVTGVLPALQINSGAGLVTLEGSVSPAGPLTINAGAAKSFTWTYSASGFGTFAFTATAAGTDAGSGNPLRASATASQTILAARLDTALAVNPPLIAVGDWTEVVLTVTNNGVGSATSVTPFLQINSGGSLVTLEGSVSPAGPVTLAAGAAQSFTWTLSSSGNGTVSLTATAVGTDAATGFAVLGASTGSLSMLAAKLDAAVALPTPVVEPGNWFVVKLTVTNTGGLNATGLTAALQITSGSPLATLESGPVPASVATLGPGAATTFQWTFSASGAGMIGLTCTAAGTDSGTGQAILASSSGTLSVVPATRLESAMSLLPANTCVGQVVTVALTVTNSGGAGLISGDAGLGLGAGSAPVTQLSGPSPAWPISIASGSSTTIQWTFSMAGAGNVHFYGSAWGNDAVSGAFVASFVASADASVGTGALLTGAISAPTTVSAGQGFNVVFTAANSGDAAATGVTVSVTATGSSAQGQLLTPPPVAGPLTIGGHTQQAFTWTYSAAGSGALVFSVTVAGSESCSGSAITQLKNTLVSVQAPAALSATASAGAASVRQGGTITVVLTVTNTGQAAALTLTPSPGVTCSGTVYPLTGGPAPAAVASVAGGANTSFTWLLLANAPGTAAFTMTASGLDANGGWAVVGAATTPVITVLPSAWLKATVQALPGAIHAGETAQVTLTVTNLGTAAANGLAPSLALSNGAVLDVVSGPSPAGGAPLAAGASRTFTWVVRGHTSGAVDLQASASGTDAGDATPVACAAAASETVTSRFDQDLVTYPNPVTGDQFTLVLALKGDAASIEVEAFNDALQRTWHGTWRSVAQWDTELKVDGIRGWAPGPYLLRARVTLADGTVVKYPVARILVKR